MLNPISPTIAGMLQNTPAPNGGNIAFFGNNGMQAVPMQPAYPSPKEMLINGYNAPIMQGYYNPYINGAANNYNSYNNQFQCWGNAYQQQNQFRLTQEDLYDPVVRATYEAAIGNNITYQQQQNMQTRIAKRMVECVSKILDVSDEVKEEMIKACDPAPLPSEIRRKVMAKRDTDYGKPIPVMKVRVYKQDILVYENKPEMNGVDDYRRVYSYASSLDRMRIMQAQEDIKAAQISAQLSATAPERMADKAENLIDYFNNYAPRIDVVYKENEGRKKSVSNVTQLYNRDEFLALMKGSGVLGYHDADDPAGQFMSSGFKDSSGYRLFDAFNRSPNLAGNTVYSPEDDSVTITAPKWIKDRNARFSSLPNQIASSYDKRKAAFLNSIGR